MNARAPNRNWVVAGSLLSLGCGWLEVEPTPVPATPAPSVAPTSSVAEPTPEAPSWPKGADGWVSPVAPEVSQHWSWQECGRIAPRNEASGLWHYPGQPILSLAISRDGSLLVSNAFRVIGWRVSEQLGESTPLWSTGGEGAFNVALSPDGRLGTVSGDVRLIFDTTNGETLRVDDSSDLDPAWWGSPCIGSELNFSPDGRLLAGKHYTSRVDVIETEHLSVVGSFTTRGCEQGIAFDEQSTLALAPDGGAVLTDFTSVAPPSASQAEDEDEYWVTLTRAPDGAILKTSCITEAGCATDDLRWQGTGYHLQVSAEGHWWSFGNELRHRPSGEARSLGESVSATVFAPNGDIIAGDGEGALIRFCRSD